MRRPYDQAQAVTTLQPELWIDRAGDAVEFYVSAFGADVRHLVGEGDDIVAQLAVGDAVFWVSNADAELSRLSPAAIGGATGRLLLVCDEPATLLARAVGAGATELAPVSSEHGWEVGRMADPFGHEWELGRPLHS